VLPVNGQPATLHGRVVSVSTSDGTTGTFVLSVSGRLYTCDVSSTTAWTSLTVQSFSALRAGMFASSVQGQMQADGTFAASSVNAQPGN
jgi:hypothetical protein